MKLAMKYICIYYSYIFPGSPMQILQNSVFNIFFIFFTSKKMLKRICSVVESMPLKVMLHNTQAKS